MSLGCARCGHCCEHAFINVPFNSLADRDDEDAKFIREHWHPNEASPTYRCDMLNPDTGLCTAHDSRPPVCANYPWYGKDPAQQAQYLGEQCSYLLDVKPADRPEGSRPLIPLTVL